MGYATRIPYPKIGALNVLGPPTQDHHW